MTEMKHWLLTPKGPCRVLLLFGHLEEREEWGEWGRELTPFAVCAGASRYTANQGGGGREAREGGGGQPYSFSCIETFPALRGI